MPDPQNLSIKRIISDIERGNVKIPQFQRDFIWSKEKAAKLIDSIIKGYPIGTFIFWKTKEPLRFIRDIGGIQLPDTPNGDYTQYVLDGQQRITSIFATILGKKVKCSNSTLDLSEIFIDLKAAEDEDLVITELEGRSSEDAIKISTLLYGDLTTLAKYKPIYHEKIQKYKSNIEGFPIPVIMVHEVPIDIATEIFTRINVGGKPLTIFEIMVAKTFDKERNFDLSIEYEKFIKRLERVGYETISEAVLLRTISVILIKECKKKQILNLNKDEFIDIYPKAVDAIESAVDYFRLCYKIPVSDLLPYQDLLVLFSYFFYIHPVKPFGQKAEYLRDVFWRISLTERYTSGTENKIAQDIRKIEQITNSELPEYDYSPFIYIQPEYIIRNGTFNIGHSYIKAILCLFMENGPKSFLDNSLIGINNEALKKGNSRNYHHFFPRAFLEKKGVEKSRINHIANIVIIDDYLNKRIIGIRPPSDYMKDFINNPHLKETMSTHLIELESFGIWEDNYDKFFEMRIQRIATELRKRVILNEVQAIPVLELFLTSKNIFAKGIRKNPGILVLKGSLASLDASVNIGAWESSLREDLIKKNILRMNTNHFIFMEDYYFNSPSAAATIICGNSRNGLITWKDAFGRTLKELELHVDNSSSLSVMID